MNLRINDQNLRFRITPDECVRLHGGETLRSRTYLPGDRTLEISVAVTSDGHTPLYLKIEDDRLSLSVEKESLAALSAVSPSRKGIETTQSVNRTDATLRLALEVDVLGRKSPR